MWRGEPQEGARLHLRQLLLHRLANHRHPPEFLHTHDDPALSDHPALRLKAGSLSMKRTFLSWAKRTLSLWDYRGRWEGQCENGMGASEGGVF